MNRILLWLLSALESITFITTESNFDRKFKFKIYETLKQLIEEYKKGVNHERI